MLDSWNEGIFCAIKSRLQLSAMKLVHAERNGEAFDSQLVIGVRESYGMDKLYSVENDVLCILSQVSDKMHWSNGFCCRRHGGLSCLGSVHSWPCIRPLCCVLGQDTSSYSVSLHQDGNKKFVPAICMGNLIKMLGVI